MRTICEYYCRHCHMPITEGEYENNVCCRCELDPAPVDVRYYGSFGDEDD